MYKMPKREQNSNKGTFGKVLNFCGSENYIGAAYLSAISSLKVGAGFSALATSQGVINSVASLLPEAVYLTREQGIEKLEDFTVVLIGCGLGLKEDAKKLMEDLLLKISSNVPILIDADGLNILATGFSLDVLQDKNLILTPHPLEASRLLGVSLKYVLAYPKDAAMAITRKYNCVTVLKLHRTIICDKDLNIHVNQNGNSALAKAGSGDVLAGVIVGLLAQRLNAFDACKLGVYLHSRAGEIASEELTEYSVMASDLPKYLHKAIKEIS